MNKELLLLTIIVSTLMISCELRQASQYPLDDEKYTSWRTYAGTPDGIRYSSNAQIDKTNVQQLQEAWRFSTQDKDSLDRSQNQCNPIVIDGVLYGISAQSKSFAINAATGEHLWTFDPAKYDSEVTEDPLKYLKVSRGLVYWQNNNETEKRIFHSAGGKIFCLNADTGEPISRFGDAGAIDLSANSYKEKGSYNPFVSNTTPGVIYNNMLIVGGRVSESADAASGDIRAYDVLTGKQKWIFHTIPHPGEVGYETWPDKEAYKKLGGANSWAGFALDQKRGIVYVPTGSVSGDFYGGIREGTNLFGNSLIALEAETGKYLWHFQTIHHDLWDRDLAANPNLVTLHKDGIEIDAVAQITKHGYIFIFDRLTGQTIFPIEEVAFSQEALPGEKPWPTQPIPTLPEAFSRQDFQEKDVTNLSPEKHEIMLRKYRQIKHTEMFTPPSKEGSWIFPGYDGGGEWGGAAIDPESQIMYVNSTELPWTMLMVDKPSSSIESGDSQGQVLYDKYCFACHGADMKGNGSSFPSLIDIADKYKGEEMLTIINNGINMMPSFKHIGEENKIELINFLRNSEDRLMQKSSLVKPGEKPNTTSSKYSILDEVPYRMTGYNRFLDDEGYPGITPPWGTLNAINLNTGKLIWRETLGEFPALTAKGIPPTGTENYGGPVVTKGGLVFIAATKDSKIRAFDKDNGQVLWQADLPVPGYATPSIYEIQGKQFIVIACGGGKIGSPSGDEYIAFALPEK